MTRDNALTRVMVTGVVCGAAWASTQIDAPAPASVDAVRAIYGLEQTPLGNLALPMSLFAMAFLVTEAIAVVTPRLRPLRRDGGHGRRVLRRIAFAFVAAELLVWSFTMWRMAGSLDEVSGGDAASFAAWQIGLILTSTVAVGLAARAIDARGVGLGFGALAGVSQLGELHVDLWMKGGPTFDVWWSLLLTLVAAGALHLGERWPNKTATLWPVPACSMAAVTLPLAWAAHQLSSGFVLPTPVFVAAAVAAGLVLAQLTTRLPSHLRGDADWTGRRRATVAYSLAFVAVVAGLSSWLTTHTLPGDPSPLDLNGWPVAPLRVPVCVFFAAFLLDVMHELRGRHRLGEVADAWEDARGWTLPIALQALHRAELPFVLRGARVHALVQVFGPHLAARVAVRPEDHARAREVIALALGGVAHEEVAVEPSVF